MEYMIKPQYLAPVDENYSEDDFSVLTSRAEVRNLTGDICNTLHHPVTILDINRLFLDSNNNSNFRIDSEIEYFSLRYACQILRKCAGVERCLDCDKFHAKCMSNDILEMKSNIEKLGDKIPEYFCDDYKNNMPQVLTDFDRPVMEYRCPILGYRELLFPINYSDKLIAVLFVGQTFVKEEGDKFHITETKTSFFKKEVNNPKLIFKNFIEIYNDDNSDEKIDSERILSIIKDSDEILINLDNILNYNPTDTKSNQLFCMNFNKKSEYYSFIHNVCNKIRSIENQLIKLVSEKQRKYFDNQINSIIEEFFTSFRDNVENKNITNGHGKRKLELSQAWIELKNVAEKIKKSLNIKEVYIFGDGESVRIEETVNKKLYPKPAEGSSKYTWSFDFSMVENDLPTAYDYIDSLNTPNIIAGLNANCTKDNNILIVCRETALMLIVDDLNKNVDLYKKMAEVIGRGLAKINGVIALCAANYLKERHVLTLRMNRHESSHISTRLNDSMKRNFANEGQNFIFLGVEKQRLVVEDLKNTIQLISHMANNIGLITGSINENNLIGRKKSLNIFELLYKWQIMFRNELKERNLDIIIPRNYDAQMYNRLWAEDGPKTVYVNSELFELLVYNLVDNAVKYAHRGSKIYISWHKKDNMYNTYELTVTSYGPYMESGDTLYELYARGTTAQFQVATGDGIGLYVVRKIAKLLGMSISHQSNFIHKYHLPLVSWYLKEDFSERINNIKKKELENYIVANNAVLENVINESEYTKIERRDLSKEYLIKRIDRETWETTFSAVISL